MFTGLERNILKSLSEALLPESESLQVSPKQAEDFDEDVEKYFGSIPSRFSLVLRLSLIFIQISPIFFFINPFRRRVPLPFTRLSVEGRGECLKRLNESPFYLVRGMLTLLKTVIILHYCGREEVKNAIESHIDLDGKRISTPKLVEENVLEFKELPEGLREKRECLEIECDVLVIGSGAGGAVVAKELAEKGLNVAVVEEGFRYGASEFSGEARDMLPLLYRDGGSTVTLPPISIPVLPFVLLPMGKCLGGTTVVNSSTCYRTPDRLLDKWTGEGLEGLSPDDMKPYFERVERILSVHPVSLNLMGEANAMTMRGAESLGYEVRPLNKNASGCDATGVCQYGCPIDAKRAMHVTYIPLATQAGAKFYTGFQVVWIVRNGNRIEKVGGFVLNRDREKIGKFVARAEVVVLAAGTVYTPYILLKNRLANSSGMVGRNLSIHPASSVMGLFPENLYGWRGVSQATGITEFFEEGITMEGTMVPPFGAASCPFTGKELSDVIGEWKKAAVMGIMIAETDSVGRIRKVPDAVPLLGKEPLILYGIGEQDKNKMIKGIAESCRVFLAAGAAKVSTGILSKPWVTCEDDVKDLERLASKLKANGLIWTAYHPQGTCRMSEDPKKGVIDSYCRSHDIRNLFICDGSMFPESVHVNPQISIMAFASRCADYIASAFSGGES